MVGMAYKTGTDTFPKDAVKAVHYFRIAAEQGDGGAAGMLAMAYHEGEGVPQSDTVALAWAGVAYAERAPNGAELENLLIGVMTPDEVAQARQILHNLMGHILSHYQRNLARGLGY
jgi:TPR repeat protein